MGSDKGPRHVAVAIVYDPGTSKVLMTTSRKHPHLWILPKGGVEKGESSGQAAVRESWEEAGSPKDLAAPTDDERLLMLALEDGTSRRPSVWHIHVIQTTEVAVAGVTDWPEKDERKRAWFSTPEALARIHQWYGDADGGDEASGGAEEAVEGKGKKAKKRGLKGGAMETAFRAFLEREGIKPAE